MSDAIIRHRDNCRTYSKNRSSQEQSIHFSSCSCDYGKRVSERLTESFKKVENQKKEDKMSNLEKETNKRMYKTLVKNAKALADGGDISGVKMLKDICSDRKNIDGKRVSKIVNEIKKGRKKTIYKDDMDPTIYNAVKAKSILEARKKLNNVEGSAAAVKNMQRVTGSEAEALTPQMKNFYEKELKKINKELQDKRLFGLKKYGAASYQHSKETLTKCGTLQHLEEELIDTLNYSYAAIIKVRALRETLIANGLGDI